MKQFTIFCILAVFLAAAPLQTRAQMIIGQYSDEAPLRTWNTLGILSGWSLGMGNTRFSSALDISGTMANPALLCSLPRLTFSISGSLNTTTLSRYGIVNTGVFFSQETNPLSRQFLWDHAGLSLAWKSWGMGIHFTTLESYSRPKTRYEENWNDAPYFTLDFVQTGLLQNINLSLARKLGEHISVGLGFNRLFGSFKKSVIDHWISVHRTITDKKSQDFKGFFINTGILWHLNEKWNLAFILQSPYFKRSSAQSQMRYEQPSGKTDIRIESEARNRYDMPLVAGIGTSCRFSSRLRAGMDISFFNWSRFKFHYFDEDYDPHFKNIIKFNAGVEYISFITLFHKRIKSPLRAGLIYDPQPMRDPHSSYVYFTFGNGLQSGKWALDLGVMIGKEFGTGAGLFAQKIVLTASYRSD